jgi:tetratricopeptide (TPR) repeat protein
MPAKPPKPTPPARTFSAEPPTAPFVGGPTPETQTVASLQSKLEDARREYALRHYSDVERILSELETSLQTVVPANASKEQVVDGDFLMASILCLRGRLRSRMESEEKARTDFLESVRLFEKHKDELERQKASARISTDYGIALARIERVQEALELLKRVSESGAAPAEAFGYLGFACQRSGRLDEAVDAYDKGLQLMPGDSTLLRYRAETLANAKKFNEAVPAFYDAAVAAWRIEDREAAQELAQRALELGPTDARALNIAVNIVFAREDADHAMALVAGVLEHDPRHAWALGLKGQLLRVSGDLNEAIKTLRAVDVRTPDLAWVLVELGSVLHQRDTEHDAEALQLLDRASVLNPQDERALYEQARIRLDRGEIAEAVTALKSAGEIDPQSVFLQCELGRAFILSGDLVRAREAYDAALLLDPKSTLALSSKGDLLRKEGDFDQALDLYRRVLRLEPDNEFVFQAMIDVLLAQARLDEALDLLEAEIARGRQVAWAQWCKGRILLEQKDLNGAAQALESAASLDPANPDLALELADALQRVDQYDRAGEAYDRALRLQPESPDHMARKAFYLTDIASFEEAHDLLGRALEKAPDQALWWAVQGWCLQHLGKPLVTEARAAFERALSTKRKSKEDEDDLWYRKGLANTLRRLGLEDEARTEFERIIREQKYKPGDDAKILAALGWCHYRLGRYDEAVRLLHASLSVDEDPNAQFDLGLVLLASSRSSLAVSEYERAVGLASKKHVLLQRGLYYVALFDLVEASRDESFGSEGDTVFKLLRSRLKDSGVQLKTLSWLPDQLPRKPSTKVR